MIPLLNRGGIMKGFVQGADRQQTTLLPECLDDWVDESNPVRAVDVFVDAPELRELGFDGVTPAATGRPGYHPSPMLKLYIYGYLNRVQSSRRLEREAGRNLEVMWLTGRLVPDQVDASLIAADANNQRSIVGQDRHFSDLAGLADDVGSWGQSGLTTDITETTLLIPEWTLSRSVCGRLLAFLPASPSQSARF